MTAFMRRFVPIFLVALAGCGGAERSAPPDDAQAREFVTTFLKARAR